MHEKEKSYIAASIEMAQSLSNKLNIVLVIGLICVVWVVVKSVWLVGGLSIMGVLGVVLTLFPLALFLPLWMGVRSLANLPETARALKTDLRDDVKSLTRQKRGLVSNLWQMKSILMGLSDEARESLSLGLLLNPLIWLLAVVGAVLIVLVALYQLAAFVMGVIF